MIGVPTGLTDPRAGITGNFAFVLEVVLVDCHHHVNHLAGSNFRLLVVFFIRVRHMAVFAFDSKGSRDELHRRNHLLGWDSLQSLDILEFFFREFSPGSRRSFRRLGFAPMLLQSRA